jgi:hypothetical protein
VIHLCRGFPSLFLLCFLVVGCGQVPGREAQGEDVAEESPVPGISFVVSGVGFSAPESVLHDPASDLYLVANTNGEAAEKDGNGFVSRVSPQGVVADLRWIDGSSSGVTLHAPKGMAIVADTLFVADIDCIRRFHRESGVPFRDLCLEEGSFLDDLASTSRGDIYFSDSGRGGASGAVYFLRQLAEAPQVVTLADGTILKGAELGGAKGLHVDGRGLLVATFGSGELFRVTPQGERLQLLAPSQMGLDGVVSLGERGVLVSSWGDSALYWIGPDGTVQSFLEGVEAPADLGLDAGRNRVLIPHLLANELTILEVR